MGNTSGAFEHLDEPLLPSLETGNGAGLEWGWGPNNLTEDLVIELPVYWGEKHTNITMKSKAGCSNYYHPARNSQVKQEDAINFHWIWGER